MKVSVVIPTRNRPRLANSLKSQIKKFNPECEVIIVDQSNSKFPNTSKAKNEGIKKAKGEVIIFFDDDVEIIKDTIQSHLKEYSDQSISGVAGRVINDGDSLPKITDVEVGKMNRLGTDFTNNFWSTKKQFVVHPYGCNWSLRKSVLESVGLFDMDFPAPLSAFEEVDLGLRVSKIGKIIFSPGALVYHHRAQTGGTRVDQKTRNNLYYQSYGRLINKHIQLPQIIFSIFILSLRTLKESPGSIISFYKGLISK